MSRHTEELWEAEILKSMDGNVRRSRKVLEMLQAFQAGELSKEELLQQIDELDQ